MSGFLSALAGRAAEKWLNLLVLPGLIYLTSLAVGAVLGQGHAFDVARLQHAIDQLATHPGASSPGAILLTVTAVLAAASLTGLAAGALGLAIEHAWTASGERWPACLLTRHRQERWRRAEVRCQQADTRTLLARAIARRNSISLVPPQHPTWIGDRLIATDQRVHSAYDLDLAAAWPRLWLVVPDSVRAELVTARDAFSSAARLTGWAVLYLIPAVLWWPTLPAATVVGITAWVRGRSAAVSLAELVEATIDLHGKALGEQLGLTGADVPFTKEIGFAISTTIRKDPETSPPPDCAPPPARA